MRPGRWPLVADGVDGGRVRAQYHRGCAIILVERLIDHILAHTGVRMVTKGEMAEDFKRRRPFNGTAE